MLPADRAVIRSHRLQLGQDAAQVCDKPAAHSGPRRAVALDTRRPDRERRGPPPQQGPMDGGPRWATTGGARHASRRHRPFGRGGGYPESTAARIPGRPARPPQPERVHPISSRRTPLRFQPRHPTSSRRATPATSRPVHRASVGTSRTSAWGCGNEDAAQVEQRVEQDHQSGLAPTVQHTIIRDEAGPDSPSEILALRVLQRLHVGLERRREIPVPARRAEDTASAQRTSSGVARPPDSPYPGMARAGRGGRELLLPPARHPRPPPSPGPGGRPTPRGR